MPGYECELEYWIEVRARRNVDSLAIEQRIFCICKRGFPEFVRIDTAAAQEALKRGRSIVGFTVTRHNDTLQVLSTDMRARY